MPDMKLFEYHYFRKRMQTGDLVEWASPTAIGGLIRLFTKKKVNHSSLLLNLDRFAGLQNRRFILEALGDGIDLNLMSKRLKEFNGKVYWSALKSKYNYRRDDIASWALDKVGTDYDYRSLFANMWGMVNQDAKKFFCSEFYHMALFAADILPGGEAARPGEFAKYMIHEPPMRIL